MRTTKPSVLQLRGRLPFTIALLLADSFCCALGATREPSGTLRRSLEEHRWELIHWGDRAIPGRDGGAPPSLDFDGNRVSGYAGCNSFSGTLSLSPNRLTTDTLATTRRACPDSQSAFEQAYLDTLRRVTVSDAEGGRLILTTEDGRSMVFLARPKPGRKARVRTVYVASQMVDCQGIVRQKCLQVRDSKEQPWRLRYDPIIGFSFQPGIEYRVRIREETVANPASERPSLRWTLDRVIGQTAIEPGK